MGVMTRQELDALKPLSCPAFKAAVHFLPDDIQKDCLQIREQSYPKHLGAESGFSALDYLCKNLLPSRLPLCIFPNSLFCYRDLVGAGLRARPFGNDLRDSAQPLHTILEHHAELDVAYPDGQAFSNADSTFPTSPEHGLQIGLPNHADPTCRAHPLRGGTIRHCVQRDPSLALS